MTYSVTNGNYTVCGESLPNLYPQSSSPPQAVMNEMNSYSFFVRTFVSMYMNSLGIEMFMTRTVHEVLWGFKDPLLSKIHSMKPDVDEYFGLMWKVSWRFYSLFTSCCMHFFFPPPPPTLKLP